MKTATLSLHQHTDGTYVLHLSTFEDGEGVRTLLNEESRPMPEVTLSEAWRVAAEMARECLESHEPAATLWAGGPWSHTG